MQKTESDIGKPDVGLRLRSIISLAINSLRASRLVLRTSTRNAILLNTFNSVDLCTVLHDALLFGIPAAVVIPIALRWFDVRRSMFVLRC